MDLMDIQPGLTDAIRSDNYVRVEELRREGEDLAEWRDEHGDKAIVFACRSGSSHVVSYLISSGCSVQEKDRRGCSLMEIAIEGSFPIIVNILHENGADFNENLSKKFDYAVDKNVLFAGNSLVYLAVNTLLEKHRAHTEDRQASVKVLKIFHKNNIQLPDRSKKETSLVDELLTHKVEDFFVETLIKSGNEITLQSPVQQVMFWTMPESILECLLARGYSVNSVSDKDPCPPLFYVCSGLKSGWDDDSMVMLELLLKHGVDVNMKCRPPLKISRNRRLPEPTWTLGGGLTALHVAAVSKSEMSKSDLVLMLCQSGADVNAQTESGDTALLLAIKNLYNVKSDEQHGLHRYKEVDTYVVQVLLQYGADPDITSNSEESCLKLALKIDGYNSIKLMLLDTFIQNRHFNDIAVEDISVSSISNEDLYTLCHSPRNLKVLARNAIHKVMKGRHFTVEDALDFLPEVVAEYIKLEYFDASWFDNPWTLQKS